MNSASAPSTGTPRFVMVGTDKPGGGVRLHASRDIRERELRWGVATDRHGTATGWHIDAEMRQVLVIDGATYGEAFARLFEIWENHDRIEARELEREQAGRELPAGGTKAPAAAASSGPARQGPR